MVEGKGFRRVAQTRGGCNTRPAQSRAPLRIARLPYTPTRGSPGVARKRPDPLTRARRRGSIRGLALPQTARASRVAPLR